MKELKKGKIIHQSLKKPKANEKAKIFTDLSKN